MSGFDVYDDIIDTRDIQERIEGIRAELDIDENGNPNQYDEDEERPAPLPESERVDLEEELRELLKLREEVEQYSEDRFEDGITMIADSYFEKYARELASDIHGGAIDEARWPFDSIDWEAAAQKLQVDYSPIEWNGYDFWVR